LGRNVGGGGDDGKNKSSECSQPKHNCFMGGFGGIVVLAAAEFVQQPVNIFFII
jgi:hypothetical protein